MQGAIGRQGSRGLAGKTGDKVSPHLRIVLNNIHVSNKIPSTISITFPFAHQFSQITSVVKCEMLIAIHYRETLDPSEPPDHLDPLDQLDSQEIADVMEPQDHP